jgi:8-oxo-dGTP pyrophosphatase MutT (NUDIX family)
MMIGNSRSREGIMATVAFTGIRESKQRFSVRNSFPQWHHSERTVVAAVCYRIQPEGEVEFLLVRTRAGRWTFPKGGVDGDRTAAAAAAREAHEEAGVLGRVEPSPFTCYLHSKREHDAHAVHAHLCEVVTVETPGEIYRTPTWFSAEKAKRRLREDRQVPYADELERVVEHAVRQLTSSHRPIRLRRRG